MNHFNRLNPLIQVNLEALDLEIAIKLRQGIIKLEITQKIQMLL